MKNMPRSFLGDVEVTSQLARTNALLVRRYHIDCEEPLAKRQLRVLEDCTYSTTEIVIALCAVVATRLRHLAVMLATLRADDIVAPVRIFKNLLALLL